MSSVSLVATRRCIASGISRLSLVKRTYRGRAGPPVANADLPVNAEQAAAAHRRAANVWRHHTALPEEYQSRRKRLIYRSKQRGWLEVDLLLGTWAAAHVPTLTADQLDEYETFCNMETVDIYNIVTLRVDPAENSQKEETSPTAQTNLAELRGNSVVKQIREWVRTHPLGRADPDEYVRVKTDANLI